MARGYRVVFLHRRGSLLPYVRTWTAASLFGSLQVQGDALQVNCPERASLASLVQQRHAALRDRRLVEISFLSVVVRCPERTPHLSLPPHHP